MKIQGAITNVKRPANGDNFGRVSVEHTRRLDGCAMHTGSRRGRVRGVIQDDKRVVGIPYIPPMKHLFYSG